MFRQTSTSLILIYVISEIVLGAELRQTEHNAHRIMEQAA